MTNVTAAVSEVSYRDIAYGYSLPYQLSKISGVGLISLSFISFITMCLSWVGSTFLGLLLTMSGSSFIADVYL